jgi:hypothetical protein
MTAPWFTFLAIIGLAILYVMVPIAADTFWRYRPKRTVHCPDEDKRARVQIDATLAAMTAVPGPPKLLVQRCSFWPDRADCAQRCTRDLA